MQLQQQLQMMQSGVRPQAPEKKDGLVEFMEDLVQMEIAWGQIQELRAGRGPERPQETKTMRALHDGTPCEMTDKQWVDYQIAFEQWELNKRLEATPPEPESHPETPPVEKEWTDVLGDLLSKHYQGVVDESEQRALVAELREYERESQALQTERKAELEEAKVKLNETKAALDEVRNRPAMD
ncbi:MAG: hypothetical protein IH630_01850, partial [Thermoplasmata archaeon]|nr:hypothetical protein [Thermoplasmata archaeon]